MESKTPQQPNGFFSNIFGHKAPQTPQVAQSKVRKPHRVNYQPRIGNRTPGRKREIPSGILMNKSMSSIIMNSSLNPVLSVAASLKQQNDIQTLDKRSQIAESKDFSSKSQNQLHTDHLMTQNGGTIAEETKQEQSLWKTTNEADPESLFKSYKPLQGVTMLKKTDAPRKLKSRINKSGIAPSTQSFLMSTGIEEPRKQGFDKRKFSNRQKPETRSNFMLMKYKKEIKVAGHGSYEIEITNLVNPDTMAVQPIFPSLMSSTNMSNAQSSLTSQALQMSSENTNGLQSNNDSLVRKQLKAVGQSYTNNLDAKKALSKVYLPKLMRSVFLTKLTAHFKHLKFSSITYKREKLLQRQLKLIQMTNLLRRKVQNQLSSAVFQIKMKASMLHIQSQSGSTSNSLTKSAGSSGDSATQNYGLMVKLRRRAIRKLETRIMSVLSHYFHKWLLSTKIEKINSSLLKQNKESSLAFTNLNLGDKAIDQLYQQINRVKIKKVDPSSGFIDQVSGDPDHTFGDINLSMIQKSQDESHILNESSCLFDMTIDGKMHQKESQANNLEKSGEDFLLGDDLLTELGDVLRQLQVKKDSKVEPDQQIQEEKTLKQDDDQQSPEKEVDHLVRRLEELDRLNKDKSVAQEKSQDASDTWESMLDNKKPVGLNDSRENDFD